MTEELSWGAQKMSLDSFPEVTAPLPLRVSMEEWIETWNEIMPSGRSHEQMWSSSRGCYIRPPRT